MWCEDIKPEPDKSNLDRWIVFVFYLDPFLIGVSQRMCSTHSVFYQVLNMEVDLSWYEQPSRRSHLDQSMFCTLFKKRPTKERPLHRTGSAGLEILSPHETFQGPHCCITHIGVICCFHHVSTHYRTGYFLFGSKLCMLVSPCGWSLLGWMHTSSLWMFTSLLPKQHT